MFGQTTSADGILVNEVTAQAPVKKKSSLWYDAWKRLKRDKIAE